INCAAIPEELLESELFGYSKGAFTGANKTGKRGLIESADGGTVFLDEIGEIPLALQAKLLQVIQDKQ
ncbi:UNVERIFIED_CONTAM: sigma-54 factor interaction domain-containing protein, partial [Bacillus sp. ATCC 13368]